MYHQVIDWVSIHRDLRLISPLMTPENQNVVSPQLHRPQSHAMHQSKLGWLVFHRHHLVTGVFWHLQVFINTVQNTLAPLDIPLYFGEMTFTLAAAITFQPYCLDVRVGYESSSYTISELSGREEICVTSRSLGIDEMFTINIATHTSPSKIHVMTAVLYVTL